jgi:hypothetical protein
LLGRFRFKIKKHTETDRIMLIDISDYEAITLKVLQINI